MTLHAEEKYSRAERQAGRQYLRELFGSIAIYMALLIPSVVYGPALDPGPLRTAALLAPMPGFLLMIWAVARHLGRIDEYQRRIALETFAMAAAITAGLTFSYGFLENAGYPRLSMFTVWGVMGGSWMVVGLLRCWRAR